MKIRLLIISSLFLVGPVFGQVSTSAASTMSRQIDAILSAYTDTLVTPTNGTDAVIIVSMKALQSDKVANLWFLISACTAGKYFNDHPSLSLNEIWFSDINGMRARPARYSVLPVRVAKSVQSRMVDGTLDLDEATTIIRNALVSKTQAISQSE